MVHGVEDGKLKWQHFAVLLVLGVVLVHSILLRGLGWKPNNSRPKQEVAQGLAEEELNNSILPGGFQNKESEVRCGDSDLLQGAYSPVIANWSAVAAGELLPRDRSASTLGSPFQKRESLKDAVSFNGSFRTIHYENDLFSLKWVVIRASTQGSSSVGPPSSAMQRLSQLAARGWKLVFVGDKSTPENWTAPPAIFLSVEAQASLGYEVHDLLPLESYSRKNIGYLFAIQHGAEVIYDTDEDTLLLNSTLAKQDLGFYLNGTTPESLEYIPFPWRTCVNPFIHFGQPSMWPRGLPLEAVSSNFPEAEYLQAEPTLKPLIQQSLANGDPDVDAVFRLTRATKSRKIRVEFDSSAPPVALPHGTMSPVNSQSAAFLRDAQWALLLPASPAPHVADIWRGFWAQRLLWDIGGSVIFLPPSSFQERSTRSYFQDFLQEGELYRDAGRLVSFLLHWRSEEPVFFDRVLALANEMARQGFWSPKDAQLTAAWLRDLIRIGYQQTRVFQLLKPRVKRSMVRFHPKSLNSTFLRQGLHKRLSLSNVTFASATSDGE